MKRSTIALVGVMVLMLAAAAQAATYTWVGGDGDWKGAGNWLDGDNNPYTGGFDGTDGATFVASSGKLNAGDGSFYNPLTVTGTAIFYNNGCVQNFGTLTLDGGTLGGNGNTFATAIAVSGKCSIDLTGGSLIGAPFTGDGQLTVNVNGSMELKGNSTDFHGTWVIESGTLSSNWGPNYPYGDNIGLSIADGAHVSLSTFYWPWSDGNAWPLNIVNLTLGGHTFAEGNYYASQTYKDINGVDVSFPDYFNPSDPSQNVYFINSVPEPATMSLLALGGVAALLKRRRIA